ncbi:unnamed protein product [Phaedon cochleariae]|uniref:Zinc finger PHD-type domain-containing protein n=1 Tax=Phaedon cochleariae TaxID=80249 RepID=A0A9N9SEZ2_PHACE|nr:unnamed protein product [Phaedon cochleariae]
MLLENTSNSSKKESIKHELEEHQREAEEAYDAKRNDKSSSLTSESFHVLTFDLQQCLPTPAIETSIAFYKRQLWTYNLTLHRCHDKQAFCFMWHEAVAARGANQIASCLYKYLQEIPENVREITFYSDTCAGQNKNSFLCVMFMLALKKNTTIHTINHKFLIPGHTHMECDGDHSIIEKKKEKHPPPIDFPSDWVNLVRLCGSKHPFQVTEMKSADFFEFSALFEGPLIQKKCKGTTWPKGFKLPLSYKGHNPISVEKNKYLIELLPYVDESFHDLKLIAKEDLRDKHSGMEEASTSQEGLEEASTSQEGQEEASTSQEGLEEASTSQEGLDDSIAELLPLPVAPADDVPRKKRKKGKVGFLNTSPYILELKQKVEEKKLQERQKLARKAKRDIAKQVRIEEEEEEDEAFPADGDESDSACIYCNELYSRDRAGEPWIQCQICSYWSHTDCAGVDRRTNNFICEICS